MHFKKIELVGFKSFADKIEIKFDTGITAIVGPNGCGKSNVADAIRWVLGEQSSKQLRGSSMQDVIFNGTKKRKSLSYCEATLIFENQDRFFDLDYDEIAVTRKLYRSGESEYLINKQQARLKDIVNLFYDSGIGRDGYSIIGQGKVEEIISSKPETRRVIFEEAAGIAKFKSRKVEAERKLGRTKENLVRLRDIISELERQLGPLKRQAEIAKKFLELRDELKDFEVNAYIFQYENSNKQKLEIKVQLDGILQELALREDDFLKVDALYEKTMQDINLIDSKIDNFHQQILTLTVQLEKQSSELKLVKERTKYLQEQNQRIETELSQGNLKTEVILKSQQEKQDKQKNLEANVKNLQDEVLNLETKYRSVVANLDLLEGETAEHTRNILDSVEKISDIKSAISKLNTEKEILNTSSLELKEKKKVLQEKFANLNQIKDEIEAQTLKAKKQSEEFANNSLNFSFKLNSLNQQIKQQEQNKLDLFAKLKVYENRHRLLTEMQAEFDGYAHSVKKLLKESEKSAQIKSKMVGVLANLIKVPQKFESAVEVALGSAVQNIVTFDEKGAKDLINHLKQNNYGRATFLPVTTMKPRVLKLEERQHLKEKGVLGVASELISYNKEIASVIQNLLGATIIVDVLDTAIVLAGKIKYGAKIVTLDGDVVNPTGSYTGGSRKSDSANLISREREIKTLTTEIEKIKIEHNQTLEKLKNLNLMLKTLNGQIEDNNLLKSQADIVLAKENERLTNIKASADTTLSETLDAENKINAFLMKIKQIETDLKVLEERQQGSKVVSKADFSQKDNERLKEVNALRALRDDLSFQITQNKIKIASSETEFEAISEDLTRLSQELISTQTMLESNKNLFEKNAQTIKQADLILAQSLESASNKPLVEKLEKIKTEQIKLSEDKQNMQTAIKTLMAERNALQDNISSLKEKKYQKQAQYERIDTDIDIMQTRIEEEYSLNYETCLPFKKDDFDFKKAVPEINKLKREISKLGYVNVNAIEDVKEVLTRYEMLSTQESDLIKAEEDLNEIIGELSKEMETRFLTQFHKINENFKITFRELFGGGNASLELLDEDNVLESGVEINAEPPGKNLKSITLLSGGEKALTAIAILFAILKLRPMPFSLLDEIEAALDEANVERFAQYLRKFAKSTQFIVITHRKPTMELADALYGVTMEEEGVSKMVSVKLSDAILNATDKEEAV